MVIAVFCFSVLCLVLKGLDNGALTGGPPFRKGETKFIAHRGLSGEFPENSLESFIAAGKSRFFWGIETDSWYIDGTFYLSHDRPQSLVGLPVLQEFLPICKLYNKTAVIDIKSDLTAVSAQALSDLCGDYDIMFVTLAESNLRLLKSLLPEVRMQLLYTFPTEALRGPVNQPGLPVEALYDLVNQPGLQTEALRGFVDQMGFPTEVIENEYDISYFYLFLTQSVIDNAKLNNKEVGVWTVNTKAEAQRYVDMGVDYLTTDYVFR